MRSDLINSRHEPLPLLEIVQTSITVSVISITVLQYQVNNLILQRIEFSRKANTSTKVATK